MRLGSRIPTEEVLLEFAEAELDSLNYGVGYERSLGRTVVDRLRVTRPSEWSTEERQRLIYTLGSMRGMFILPLLALEPEWSEGTLESSELANLRATLGAWWGDLSPELDLATFISAFEAGKDAPGGGLRSKVSDLASGFDLSRMRGRPILLGEAETGPFTILEGTKRLMALTKRARDGLPVPNSIPIYVGLTPIMSDWMFYALPNPWK